MLENVVSHMMLTLFLLSRYKGSIKTQLKILHGATPLTFSAAILLQDGLDEFSKKEVVCTIMNE